MRTRQSEENGHFECLALNHLSSGAVSDWRQAACNGMYTMKSTGENQILVGC